MKPRTLDRYAALEAQWISKPTYLSRRFPLEDLLVQMTRDELIALKFYIVYNSNIGRIKDIRTAKAIHTIIGEVLGDGAVE